MGNYIANFEFLSGKLQKNAENGGGSDFGNDIIPQLIAQHQAVYAYDYTRNIIIGQSSHPWRDVGTIDSYWQANMDIVEINPNLNLYNPDWPTYTPADNLPPAKINSLTAGSGQFTLSGGAILQECYLHRTVLGRNVCIFDQSRVEQSVLFDNVTVGSGCDIFQAIIDECVDIPAGTTIGRNRADDIARGFYVDKKDPNCSIVIVPRGYVFQ
jgi:glucose-1-phosphate adenylyltransferase